MRAFLLIALLAMAATVSCQSTVCKTQSDAYETNANLTQTEAYIVKSGCTELNFNDTQCTQTGDNYACQCTQTFDNKTAWETAVTGAGGRACYLSVEYTLVGAVVVNNVTREVRVTGTQTGVENLAVPTVCNDTDIKAAFAPFVTKLVAVLTNAQNIQKGNATWVSGSMSVSACGTTVTETRTFGTGTTNPPTTQAPTTPSGTTTQPPTGSSTGKSGASIIASSFALVASLIAAVTILA